MIISVNSMGEEYRDAHFCETEIEPLPYMVYENVSILRVTQVYSAINRARKRDVEGAVPYIIM